MGAGVDASRVTKSVRLNARVHHNDNNVLLCHDDRRRGGKSRVIRSVVHKRNVHTRRNNILLYGRTFRERFDSGGGVYV